MDDHVLPSYARKSVQFRLRPGFGRNIHGQDLPEAGQIIAGTSDSF